MRTKTLLCAAAIAAGALTAVAQSNVYSLNVVGYVNVPVPTAYSILANPLSTGTNGAQQIMPIETQFDGSFFLTWENGTYKYTGYDSGYGGWVDNNNNPTQPPYLPPGKGFFFNNPGAATTVTFVGEVVPAPGVTNAMTVGTAYSLIGSPMPVAGPAAADVTDPNASPVPGALNYPVVDGHFTLTWNNGTYLYKGFDSGYGGWVDNNNNTTTPPSFTVGQGFFYNNPGAAFQWKQALP